MKKSTPQNQSFFLFQCDQNHYYNLTSKIMIVCEQICKKPKNSGNDPKCRLCEGTAYYISWFLLLKTKINRKKLNIANKTNWTEKLLSSYINKTSQIFCTQLKTSKFTSTKSQVILFSPTIYVGNKIWIHSEKTKLLERLSIPVSTLNRNTFTIKKTIITCLLN